MPAEARPVVQANRFPEQGVVFLPGFHPRARLSGIRQRLVDDVAKLTAARGALRSLRTLPAFQQIVKLSAAVDSRGLHEALVTPAVLDQVRQLAGRAPTAIQPLQLLLSPPLQGEWTLQRLNWHVDIAAGEPDRIPGIQAFFLLDEVAPHGGATLALAGSHRLGARGALVREVLRSQGDAAQALKGEGVEIVEMCGRGGDVFLMDMRVLHTPSINATKRARLMATARFLFHA